MKNLLLLITTFFILSTLSGQTITGNYAKVKVDLTTTDITTLAQLGLEIDHGIYARGKHLINDFSRAEVALLDANRIRYEVLIPDVEAFYVERNQAHFQHGHDHGPAKSAASCDGDNDDDTTYDYPTPANYVTGSMGGYLTYAELMTTLNRMAELYPDLITEKAAIGDITTHEGRPIYWLRLSDNATLEEDEPELLYTALHHAREPNSLSQMIFYIWYLLENYETNEEVKYLVDNVQMYFIPCVNPDGYIHNQTISPNGGGLWRKNRRSNDNGSIGVDLNRNYGFNWGFDNNGSSPNPDSDTYRGPSGFSEPETQAVRDFCNDHEFKITLNYHTFGNLLVYPWGYNDAPTPDNDTYRAMATIMTRENDFTFGTGTETVGYVVNGDSDDWMYGETDSKPAIFSFTPEVGAGSDGFWPAANRIDFLNKSNVRQNLTAAHLLLNYGEAREENASNFLSAQTGSLDMRLKKYGLPSGELSLTVTPLSDNVTITNNPIASFELGHLEEENLLFDYQLVTDISDGDEVSFLVTVGNGAFASTDTIRKQYISGNTTVLFSDNSSDLDNWAVTDAWNTTTSTFVSAPSSITDSPNGQYGDDMSSSITLNSPIDLAGATRATLKFQARWDIETDYDYVQVMASTDGSNFTPLCGNFTTSGSNFQDENQPLYDGSQTDWVTEEVDLSNYLGQQIWIRFRLESDGSVVGDGFYFDDLSIEIVNEAPSDVKQPFTELANFQVSPNPVSNGPLTASFELPQRAEQLRLRLVNTLGQTVSEKTYAPLSAGLQQLTITELPKANGIYFLQLHIDGQRVVSRRVVKSR